MQLTACVLGPDGLKKIEAIETAETAAPADAVELGRCVAEALLRQGAAALVESALAWIVKTAKLIFSFIHVLIPLFPVFPIPPFVTG